MPTIGWTVTLDGSTHRVEVDHNWYLGQRTLRLDGTVLAHSATLRHALLDRGSRHAFRVGQHGCEVCIESNWIGPFRYELLVDGRALAPSTPIPSQAEMTLNLIKDKSSIF